jgi:hypothetical protein
LACNQQDRTLEHQIKNRNSFRFAQAGKRKRAIEVARLAEIRKSKKEKLSKIDELIEVLEADNSESNHIEILKKAYEELEVAKKIIGSKKREKYVEDKLNSLRERMEFQ